MRQPSLSLGCNGITIRRIPSPQGRGASTLDAGRSAKQYRRPYWVIVIGGTLAAITLILASETHASVDCRYDVKWRMTGQDHPELINTKAFGRCERRAWVQGDVNIYKRLTGTSRWHHFLHFRAGFDRVGKTKKWLVPSHTLFCRSRRKNDFLAVWRFRNNPKHPTPWTKRMVRSDGVHCGTQYR